MGRESAKESGVVVARDRVPVPASPPQPTFDFEALYALYPRKEGKAAGLKTCATEIRTEADFERLKTAITNYAAMCAKEGRDRGYIKHFSSFMSAWTDYVQPVNGSAAKLGWLKQIDRRA